MMNSVRRPGSNKPNRCGGRRGGRGQRGSPRGSARGAANVPSLPTGGFSNSQKAGSKYFDEFEDVQNYDEEDFDSDDEEWEASAKSSSSQMATKEKEKPPPRRKIQLQILHMSEESQTRLTKTLEEIHGQNYRLRDKTSYKDKGNSLGRRFWIQDRQLLVRGVEGTTQNDSGVSEIPTDINKFALDKLKQFGFHQKRCIKALQEFEGDVGKTLEDLISKAFKVKLDANFRSEDVESLAEMKDDEKLALQSIYAQNFEEVIPNKVWRVKLNIPAVFDLINKEEKSSRKASAKSDSLPKDVCRFYLKGYCKFGIRCNFRHIQPEKIQNVDDRHLKAQDERNRFSYLEIRFPFNSGYPNQPPLICFYTDVKQFPSSVCLNISQKLQNEAILLAESGSPSVFSLVSLIEIKETISESLEAEPHAYSFDPDFVKENEEEEEEEVSDSAAQMLEQVAIGTNLRRSTDSKRGKRTFDKILQTNEVIRKRFHVKQPNEPMMKTRRALPAWTEKEKILKAVESSQVVVISGMTGCGKSTQVPQYIIDHWLQSDKTKEIHCNVICTQPRRISAIGVAERVAAERNEKAGNLIGYQIRLENKTSQYTRLLFCTTGILLKRLESDPNLENVTHVIVDEVHERSEESDFLLMILKAIVTRKKNLRVILMSATINADLFSNYFGQVPILEIPGKTFPVEQIFLDDALHLINYVIEEGSTYARPEENIKMQSSLTKEQFKGGRMGDAFIDDFEIGKDLASEGFKEPKDNQRDEKLNIKQLLHRYSHCDDSVCRTLSLMDFHKINYDLIESVLVYIAEGDHDYPKEGSILVFLPGMQEIMTLYKQMVNHPVFGSKAGKFQMIPLHSSLTSEEQSRVFSKPRMGVRKIVISTNLAETSITIDDCVFVVDAGRMKEKHFDSTKNMESLDTVWVSRANAMQRKGRAGRVMPGFCFHLYTKFRFDHHLSSDPLPEIKRIPLEQLLLRIKVLPLFQDQVLKDILMNLIEPPDTFDVDSALERLQGVGALDKNNDLTPLGFHLASLPVDVRIGKLLLFGSIFRCLDSALTIAASLSYKSPFVSPFGKRDEAMSKKVNFAVKNSDHLAVLRAYNGWQEATLRSHYAGYNYANEHFLSQSTLQTIVSMKHQFLELLSSIGFVTDNITMQNLTRASRNGADSVRKVTRDETNVNCSNYKLVASVLCAALYPNVVQVLSPEIKYKQTASGAMTKPPEAKDLKFKTKTDGYVNVHPSSVNFNVPYYESSYLVFHEKIKTSRVFIRELSMIPVYPLILFGGADGAEVHMHDGKFVLSLENGWMKFVTYSQKIAELLKDIRQELDDILEEKIRHPTLNLMTYPKGELVISTIVNLITIE